MNSYARKLQTLSERITRAVCSVHGVVTQAEIDERNRLESVLGERWDAINGKWVPLTASARSFAPRQEAS